MADYKSMYYELLLASERAITTLKEAHNDACYNYRHFPSEHTNSLRILKYQCYKAYETLFIAVRKSEDIYIETCTDDPESQD